MLASIDGMLKDMSVMITRPPSTTFGEVVYPAGGVCGPRTQRDVQIVIVHEGVADIRIDGDERHLAAGEVALLHPGRREFFRFSVGSRTVHSWCALDPTSLSRELLRTTRQLPFSRPLSWRMHELIRLGLSLAGAGERDGVGALRDALGIAVVRELVLDAEPGEAALPVIVRRAQCLIDARSAEPLTLTTIARGAGASVPHLIRLFRQHLGETPSRYLWKVRTVRGVRLLADTGLSVSEIAARSGFQSPFHFSRLAKLHFGAAPVVLRERSWEKGPGEVGLRLESEGRV